MHVLLLNPPLRFRSPIVLPPLGLAYLAARLARDGHRVEILDAPALGINLRMVIEEVRRRRPEVLGIGGMTPSFDLTRETVTACRPFVRHIALGGPHVSALGTAVRDSVPEADFFIIGEGEESFAELIQALEHNQALDRIPGLLDRETPEVSERPPIADLDSLPFPARDLLPNRRYRHPASPSAPAATLVTSRGCPHPCSFCDKAVFGGRLRLRSPGSVADEIETIVDQFGIRELIFYDDNFLSPPDRARAIADEIRQRGLRVGFRCEGRVDGVTPDLLQALKAAGCHTIAYGIESANPHGLAFLRKGFSADDARRVLAMTRQAGLRAGAYFILGIPVETLEDMERTIDFAIELNPDFAQFSILSPTPGAELFRRADQDGVLESSRLVNPFDQDRARPYLASLHWNAVEVGKTLKKAYRKFYLRPGFIRKFLSIRKKPFNIPPLLESIRRTAGWMWKR